MLEQAIDNEYREDLTDNSGKICGHWIGTTYVRRYSIGTA